MGLSEEDRPKVSRIPETMQAFLCSHRLAYLVSVGDERLSASPHGSPFRVTTRRQPEAVRGSKTTQAHAPPQTGRERRFSVWSSKVAAGCKKSK